MADDLLPGDEDWGAYDLTRIRELLDGAVWRLPEWDRDMRIMHCWTTGEHGVRMTVLGDGETLAFWWGGKPLLHAARRRLLRYGGDEPGLS